MSSKVFIGLENLIAEETPLAHKTTFRIGGPARFFSVPATIDDLISVVTRAYAAGLPVRVLGGGSNLLIDDSGVNGLVVHLSQLRHLQVKGNRLYVGPGCPLPGLVNFAARNGLAGLEIFAGIPGQVGGMLRTNSGGRHGSLCDVLHSVTLLLPDGSLVTRRCDEFRFSHRRSNLTQEIAVEIVLNVQPGDPDSLLSRRDEIMRAKVASQPLNERTAGCVFRNPDGEYASRLIDTCGLKGRRVGHAMVSPTHANFICNEHNARCADVLHLIDQVRSEVDHQTGFELEMEVIRWSRS